MSRSALKFKDLDGFFKIAAGMGFTKILEDLIYEQGELPYCSAYLIPTDLLPSAFDLNQISKFAGSITTIEDIRYLGTERFTTDFMIYPLSLSGFLEVETFGQDEPAYDPTNDPEGRNMNIVINIEDGGGKEFYLAKENKVVALDDTSNQEPHIFKTAKQADKQVEELRKKYSEACQVYSLERHEFDARRKQLLGN